MHAFLNEKKRRMMLIAMITIVILSAVLLFIFLPRPIRDVGMINDDYTDFDRYAAHFPNGDPREFPEYYAGTYHELSGEIVFVIHPGYEYEDPVGEIREFTGNPNVKVDYAIYSEKFLKAVKDQISFYATSPPEDDPFKIVGIGAADESNRVTVISSEKWDRKKLQKFKDYFGIYSEGVVFHSVTEEPDPAPTPSRSIQKSGTKNP